MDLDDPARDSSLAPATRYEPELPDALPTANQTVATAPKELWGTVCLKVYGPNQDFETNRNWLMGKIKALEKVNDLQSLIFEVADRKITVAPKKAPWALATDVPFDIDFDNHIEIRKAHADCFTPRHVLYITLPLAAYLDRWADTRILEFIRQDLVKADPKLSVNWLSCLRGHESWVKITFTPRADEGWTVDKEAAETFIKALLQRYCPGEPLIRGDLERSQRIGGKKVQSCFLICPTPEVVYELCDKAMFDEHPSHSVTISFHPDYIPVRQCCTLGADVSQAPMDPHQAQKYLNNWASEYNSTAMRPAFFSSTVLEHGGDILITVASDPFLAHWATLRPFVDGTRFEHLAVLNGNNLVPERKRKEVRSNEKNNFANGLSKQVNALSKDMQSLKTKVGSIDKKVDDLRIEVHAQGRATIELVGLEKRFDSIDQRIQTWEEKKLMACSDAEIAKIPMIDELLGKLEKQGEELRSRIAQQQLVLVGASTGPPRPQLAIADAPAQPIPTQSTSHAAASSSTPGHIEEIVENPSAETTADTSSSSMPSAETSTVPPTTTAIPTESETHRQVAAVSASADDQSSPSVPLRDPGQPTTSTAALADHRQSKAPNDTSSVAAKQMLETARSTTRKEAAKSRTRTSSPLSPVSDVTSDSEDDALPLPDNESSSRTTESDSEKAVDMSPSVRNRDMSGTVAGLPRISKLGRGRPSKADKVETAKKGSKRGLESDGQGERRSSKRGRKSNETKVQEQEDVVRLSHQALSSQAHVAGYIGHGHVHPTRGGSHERVSVLVVRHDDDTNVIECMLCMSTLGERSTHMERRSPSPMDVFINNASVLLVLSGFSNQRYRPMSMTVLFMLIALVLSASTASAHDPMLTILTLNVDRLSEGSHLKAQETARLVLDVAPSLFVLTETAILDGPHAVLYDLLRAKYKFYTSGKHRNTWSISGGITIGVHSSIPSQSEKLLDDKLDKRLLPVSIRTPKWAGSKELVKTYIVGLYAPQIHGNQEAVKGLEDFWKQTREQIAGRDRWIIAGDMNYTLRDGEANEGSMHRLLSHRENQYRRCLQGLGGVDLWSLQDMVDLQADATYIREADPYDIQSRDIQSVIDRIAIGSSIPAGYIRTLPVNITGTHHRPVWCRLPMPVWRDDIWDCPPRRARLTKPMRQDDERFVHLRTSLDKILVDHPALSHPITSHDGFDQVYQLVSESYKHTCEKVFERPKPRGKPLPHRPTREERDDTHTLTILKGAIAAIKQNNWDGWTRRKSKKDMTYLNPNNLEDKGVLLSQLITRRRKVAGMMRDAREQRAEADAKRLFDKKVDIAIKTGSVKKLSPNTAIQIPPIVRHPDRPEEVVTEPNEHIETWRRHFETILLRHEPPDIHKPWMDSEASHKFRLRTEKDPFQWPKQMSVQDLKTQLKTGNRSPAPGPEEWEKWPLLRTGDAWLSLITRLVNYIIEHDYWPGYLKENYIVPLYKKGDPTDPGNYRGIVLANTLQTIVSSWTARCLQSYSWKMGFIPPEQIAVQQGVHVGDMTHLLSSLDGWGKLVDETIYALKRDQKKGYDYIHESAWRDACTFFGIPQKMVDAEQKRCERVELRVRAREQISEPLYTTGQIKQGDALSPLKYVLITAMAIWWLREAHPTCGMVVNSHIIAKSQRPHSDADTMTRTIQIVAAMDDTILFAKGPGELQLLTFAMETFQTAYNMETEWEKPEKTTLFLFGREANFEETQVWDQRSSSMQVLVKKIPIRVSVGLDLPGGHKVRLENTQNREFLRTPINDPRQQERNIDTIIRSFTFPRPGGKLPMTALRKIANMTLSPKIESRLQLHPVTLKGAERLSSAISVKIRDYYGMPYATTPSILATQLDNGGFDFPNIPRMNAKWSISALHRQLNSQNRQVRETYAIIHSTFQCGSREDHRKVTHTCNPPLVLHPDDNIPQTKRGASTERLKTWETARSYLEVLHMDILPLKASSAVKPVRRHTERNDFTKDIERLFVKGQDTADSLELLCTHAMRHWYWDFSTIRWAVDGSVERTAPHKSRKAGIAIIGPVNVRLRLKDEFATTMDAEGLAIVIAMMLDDILRKVQQIPSHVRTTIFTDDIAMARRAQNAAAGTREPIKIQESSRHVKRWLQAMAWLYRDKVNVVHVKAHTDNEDLPSRMQAAADQAAKEAKESIDTIRVATMAMDIFAMKSSLTGITHGYTPEMVDIVWNHMAEPRVAAGATDIDEYYNPYYFKTCKSTFSTVTQLQIRSGQLPTGARNRARELKEDDIPQHCRRCKHAYGMADEAHVFVECRGSQKIIGEQIKQAESIVTKYINSKKGSRDVLRDHLLLAEALFRNGSAWSTGKALYWRGLLPANFAYETKYRYLYNQLAGLAVISTGRLWGYHQRNRRHNTGHL
jgi:hypothetical protein